MAQQCFVVAENCVLTCQKRAKRWNLSINNPHTAWAKIKHFNQRLMFAQWLRNYLSMVTKVKECFERDVCREFQSQWSRNLDWMLELASSINENTFQGYEFTLSTPFRLDKSKFSCYLQNIARCVIPNTRRLFLKPIGLRCGIFFSMHWAALSTCVSN